MPPESQAAILSHVCSASISMSGSTPSANSMTVWRRLRVAARPGLARELKRQTDGVGVCPMPGSFGRQARAVPSKTSRMFPLACPVTTSR
jgi:hypothetical protein